MARFRSLFRSRQIGRRGPKGRRLGFEALEGRKLLTGVAGDFNGDGFDDLAIGVPFDDVGPVRDAGAVEILYSGGVGGLSSTNDAYWHQDSPGIRGVAERGDRFGESLAAGDFNGDGFTDLAIGVPGQDNGAIVNAGTIHILYGSAAGLAAAGNQILRQGSADVRGVAQANDEFGTTLAAGDFNGDGRDDLAIGVPLENVDSIADAGVVQVLYGSATGLTGVNDDYWFQGAGDVQEAAEAGDRFGFTLATGDFDGNGRDDLAIGVPYEDVGALADAGVVQVLYGLSTGLSGGDDDLWRQGAAGILGAAAANDHFGFSLAAGDFDGNGRDDLAIGVPDEDVLSAANAGAVQVLYGTLAGTGLAAANNQYWRQGAAGVRGDLEAHDRFGLSLTAGDFDGDLRDDLAIGVPFEDVGTTVNAGVVQVLYGSATRLTAANDDYWQQGDAGVRGEGEAGDRFGTALLVGDFDGDGRHDLTIGVPLEDVGSIIDAGAVQVLYGSSTGLATGNDDYWDQNTTGVDGTAQSGDQFGFGLG
ncbi:MAG: FG-GAP repeat protein [Pirellulales bacterium]|nr:FG-GAP repeat protein [Pirellulales bacterium]